MWIQSNTPAAGTLLSCFSLTDEMALPCTGQADGEVGRRPRAGRGALGPPPPPAQSQEESAAAEAPGRGELSAAAAAKPG